MFTYYSRILDKYDKPITAFAIFTEANAAFRPCEYYREFLGTSVSYRFNSFKILEQDEQMLKESDNPFAIVVLTALIALKRKHVPEDELLKLKIELTKNLVSRNFPKSKIRRLLIFLRCYIRFENRETDIKFGKVLNQITQTRETMGIEELMREEMERDGFARTLDRLMDTWETMGSEEFVANWARQEAKAETTTGIAKNLLRETSLTIEEIARLVGLSPGLVQKLRDNR